ncbi:MAG: OmpA family protein [Pseudomonadota bacterium]|nr:OmpA family protein [Pseudomonadota bacterium]
MSERVQESTSARVQSTRRYVRQRGGPGLAFIPYGLIPAIALLLLTLFALFPFASYWIEENAEQTALASLRAEGEDWARVTASGQWITLTGEAPNADRAAKAVTLIRSSEAPTFLGRARPVTRIIDRTTLAAPASTAERPASDPAPTENNDAATAAIVTPPAQSQTRIEACDRAFRELLLESKIEFGSGSARISPSSAGLLNDLARAVTGCELRVTIVGHTDSTGSAGLNERLSLARAQAVRDALVIRGVSTELLIARGFGEAQPIASNDTPEGRELNRRIEFNVLTNADAQE